MSNIRPARTLAIRASERDGGGFGTELRDHRNEIGHDVVDRLAALNPSDHRDMWIRAERALYRLSQHNTIMEIGGDPALANVNWKTVKGHEYLIFEAIVEKVGVLSSRESDDESPDEGDAWLRKRLEAEGEPNGPSDDPFLSWG